jgi:glycosyltransferase involved in cell wall biosynthesis
VQHAGAERTRLSLLPFVAADASPSPSSLASPFAARRDIVFVGNGENPTNFLGVEWFCNTVWPRRGRHRALRSASLVLVGAPPSRAGGWRCPNDTSVEQRGRLDDAELEATLSRARVFVAPILHGTGLNTKNLLALRHGLPLVTTAKGLAGLARAGGEAAFARVVTARDAEDAIATLAHVYGDEAAWSAMRAAALARAAAFADTAPMERALDAWLRRGGFEAAAADLQPSS